MDREMFKTLSTTTMNVATMKVAAIKAVQASRDLFSDFEESIKLCHKRKYKARRLGATLRQSMALLPFREA